MVRYFYAWTPLVVIGAVFLLCMPWLGLIAFMLVAIVALAAFAGLAWTIVFVPYMLLRAITRHWNTRRGAGPRTATAGWQGVPAHAVAPRGGRQLQAQHHAFDEGHVS